MYPHLANRVLCPHPHSKEDLPLLRKAPLAHPMKELQPLLATQEPRPQEHPTTADSLALHNQ